MKNRLLEIILNIVVNVILAVVVWSFVFYLLSNAIYK
jgi:hypothetical protein